LGRGDVYYGERVNSIRVEFVCWERGGGRGGSERERVWEWKNLMLV